MQTHAQSANRLEKPKSNSHAATSREDSLTDGQHRSLIAIAAYFLAEHRHFEPGHEMEDWLAAERQIGSEGMSVS
jgi:hypothetical protein